MNPVFRSRISTWLVAGATLLLATPTIAIDHLKLVGFGTVGGGVTGGAGGVEVKVTDMESWNTALKALIKAPKPTIFVLDGKFSQVPTDQKINVKDVKDITILGSGNGAEITGFGIMLTRAENVLIRNVKIHHVKAGVGEGDGLHISESKRVWVDHCEFFNDDPTHESSSLKDTYDGLLDITHGSDNITVSWNYFHDSWKSSLLGHSENNASEDQGKLHVTYHHNRYQRINSRTPLNRFGNTHVFNNLYEGILSTAINSRIGACVRVEGNHFASTDSARAILSVDSDILGSWEVRDNLFSKGWRNAETVSKCTNTDITYNYSSLLQPAGEVQATVIALAGVGKLSANSGNIRDDQKPSKVFLRSGSGALAWTMASSEGRLRIYSRDGSLELDRRLTRSSGSLDQREIATGWHLAVLEIPGQELVRTNFVVP